MADTEADLTAQREAYRQQLNDAEAGHRDGAAAFLGGHDAGAGGGSSAAGASGDGGGSAGADAPSGAFPPPPNPGPDVGSIVRDLDAAYTQELAEGRLSDTTMQQMRDLAQAHADAGYEHASNWARDDVAPMLKDVREQVGGEMAALRDAHPDVDLGRLQSGDIPLAELSHPGTTMAHAGVELEAGFNTEVLNIKQEYLDLARDVVAVRSQAEGADPAQIEAFTARIDQAQAELDAARVAVDEHAAGAHHEIDQVTPALEELDRTHPHAGQTSETGPYVPLGDVADNGAHGVVLASADVSSGGAALILSAEPDDVVYGADTGVISAAAADDGGSLGQSSHQAVSGHEMDGPAAGHATPDHGADDHSAVHGASGHGVAPTIEETASA